MQPIGGQRPDGCRHRRRFGAVLIPLTALVDDSDWRSWMPSKIGGQIPGHSSRLKSIVEDSAVSVQTDAAIVEDSAVCNPG